ncbi:MAG: hypothetical protein MSB10_04880 [Clostridiales bacterium]|uniref:hypothetical protein n=1 Tax=Flavonifractor porci TaxID=3133422 RepID=UPI0030A08D62|nr:hypothetical protein [Clostridiales bacterium]
MKQILRQVCIAAVGLLLVLILAIAFFMKLFHPAIPLNDLLELPSDSDIEVMFFFSACEMGTNSNYHPYTTSDDSVESALKQLILDTTVKHGGSTDIMPVDDTYEMAFFTAATDFTGREHYSFYMDPFYIYFNGQFYSYDNDQIYEFVKEKAMQPYEPSEDLEKST